MFILGSLASAFAQDVPWLIGGRLFIGAAIGIASFVAPLYLSEMAPARIRRAGSDVDAELHDIRVSLAKQQHAGLRMLLRPDLRMPLIAGTVLAALQQVTGINTVIYYAPPSSSSPASARPTRRFLPPWASGWSIW
jgi:hypothetical protein